MKNLRNKNLIFFLLAYLIVASMAINLDYLRVNELSNLRTFPWIFYLIIYIAIYKFILFRRRRINKPILIIAFLMSIIYILAFFITKYETPYYAINTIIQLGKSIVALVGYTILTYYLLDYVNDKIKSIKFVETKNKVIDFIFNKHPFLVSFIIILIFYLPIIYIFYPGVVMGDGLDEIRQYNHSCTWSLNYINLIDENIYINGHHSPFHTVILGFIVNLFSKEYGVFAYTLLQVLFQAFVLAYSLKIMRELNVNYKLRIFFLILYCILPFFSINAVGVYKDISFCLMMLLYICFLIEYTYLNEHKWFNLLKLIISGILVTLLTNKGLYVVFFTTIFMIIKYWSMKKVVVLLLIPLVFYVCYAKVLLPALNVTPGSIQEALSLPIQQVSRYVIYYDDELTKEEKESISKVLVYDRIKELYKADNADPIKNKFNKDYTSEDVKNFMLVWAKLFFKHPGVYLSAFANMASGYFNYDKNNGIVYFKTATTTYCDNLAEEYLQPHQDLINKTESFWLLMRKVPLIGALLNVAFYVWLLILLVIYVLINKYRKYIIPFIPVLVILLFCFVSPVTGNKRYIYPIIYAMPILISYVSVMHYSNKKEV